MAAAIDTDRFSTALRARSIKVAERSLLISNYLGSEQESDLTEPPNCRGFGRVRHFRRTTSTGWPTNPLPIDPAARALNIPAADLMNAQVFQNASCNWRCWYCYVPFDMLSADESRSGWLTASEMVDLYQQEISPPKVIDLSGGQPDLVPEWIPWMMQELASRGMDNSTYLWSDDNLSNDYFWTYLTSDQRDLVTSYANYGKVCCFKGFDAESFAFNTGAAGSLFDRQFDLMRRFVRLGLDVYGYVTMTGPNMDSVSSKVRRLVDRLQEIHPNLPLRTVPLEVHVFSPVRARMSAGHSNAMPCQQLAIAAWQQELEARFNFSDRRKCVCDVSLN